MLTAAEFNEVFHTFERSALRLESQRHTDIPTERPSLRAFLAGELPEVRPLDPTDWTRMVVRQVDAGRTFQRVRVMDEPLTDYNRYMIYSGYRNVTFGEDIRYLERSRANELDLPDHDFWILDESRLVELRFTGDGRLIAQDLITDPVIVGRHLEWYRRAAPVAVRSADYVAEDPSRAWPPVRLRKQGAAKGA